MKLEIYCPRPFAAAAITDFAAGGEGWGVSSRSVRELPQLLLLLLQRCGRRPKVLKKLAFEKVWVSFCN